MGCWQYVLLCSTIHAKQCENCIRFRCQLPVTGKGVKFGATVNWYHLRGTCGVCVNFCVQRFKQNDAAVKAIKNALHIGLVFKGDQIHYFVFDKLISAINRTYPAAEFTSCQLPGRNILNQAGTSRVLHSASPLVCQFTGTCGDS